MPSAASSSPTLISPCASWQSSSSRSGYASAFIRRQASAAAACISSIETARVLMAPHSIDIRYISQYIVCMKPIIQPFFGPATGTVTYVAHDGAAAAISDSVHTSEPKSARTDTRPAERVIESMRPQRLRAEWILESRAHAAHLSAAPYVRAHLGGRVAIGERIGEV